MTITKQSSITYYTNHSHGDNCKKKDTAMIRIVQPQYHHDNKAPDKTMLTASDRYKDGGDIQLIKWNVYKN